MRQLRCHSTRYVVKVFKGLVQDLRAGVTWLTNSERQLAWTWFDSNGCREYQNTAQGG